MGKWVKAGSFACLLIVMLASGCDKPRATSRTLPGPADRSSILVRCDTRCDEAAASIESRGGSISRRYLALGVVAASVPRSSLAGVTALFGESAVFKENRISAPQPIEERGAINDRTIQSYRLEQNTVLGISKIGATAVADLANIAPTDFSYDTILTGAAQLQRRGYLGKDVVVAIIDSGTANNPDKVPVLAGSVIGGESFLNPAHFPDEPSATSTLNDPHGTMVGTMIAAHGVIHLSPTDKLVKSLQVHLPQTVRINRGVADIAMVGVAPAARIYAMKTFPANGDGTSNAVVLAAMDRALTLKQNFDAGIPSGPVTGDGSEEKPFVYDSLNIRVINLSLGGPTLFSGREIDELMIRKLYDAGITVVVAAGNEGFAAITTGSPATGPGAISVGAATLAPHERVLRDLQRGPGVGIQFRPTLIPQVARFSSRGPTADGRVGIDLIASGHAVFVQGASGSVELVSGTSFSAPTVAGAAALLIGAMPTATASAIRAALIESANAELVGPRAKNIDQGHGFLNLPDALQMLKAGNPTAHLPLEPIAKPDTLVANNLREAGFPTVAFVNGSFNTTVKLVPGQVQQFFVSAFSSTEKVTVDITNITPTLPLARQNKIFGDDLGVIVLEAPTSINVIQAEDFINADTTYTINRPQAGVMRIALLGDWTNVGDVTATLTINRVQSPSPLTGIAGSVSDRGTAEFTFTLPPDTAATDLTLSWTNNWSVYPTHDLDLILIAPDGTEIPDGATLSSPERVHIDAPAAGTWTARVEGFALHEYKDRFQLGATDGNGAAIVLVPVPVAPVP